MTSNETTLQEILLSEPQEFLQPSPELQKLSISLIKQLLDPLAVCSRKWRKQYGMEELHVDGFSVEQVWEQSSSLVELLINSARLTTAKSSTITNGMSTENIEDYDSEEEEDDEDEDDDMLKPSEGLSDESEDQDGSGSEDNDDEDEDDEDDEEAKEERISVKMNGKKKALSNGSIALAPISKDVHGLNDSFFSIDEFNRDTEQFEDADARGLQLNSDEESIDWNADPDLIAGEEEGDENDDEDEDEDEDMDEGAMDRDMENALYRDFFVPAHKGKKKGSKKKADKENTMSEEEDDGDEGEEEGAEDGEFDIGPVHRDLFDLDGEDDYSDGPEDPDSSEDEDNSSRQLTKAGTSSHNRRQAALVEEIRKLERENVAKRDWTLSGEARAAQRPLNSLLEEDLDFERAGKPVPVNTQAVTEDLEALIKRRILAEDFDELEKRTELRTPKDKNRDRIELDDSKSKKSLAEIYEEDHLRSIDPANHPTTASASEQALKKEIKELFSDAIRKLDALSSWHYTPKMPQASIGTVVDAPTLEIEDAQPSAAGGGPLMGHSNIAPQEIYSASAAAKDKDADKSEFITKGGVPVSRAEMTTSEKRKRRRDKAKSNGKAKAAAASQTKPQNKEKASSSKQKIVQRLKANNVTVIGKDGERRDLDGKAITEKQQTRGATLKLM